MIRYILLWFPLLLIAVTNGTLRDLWYKKYTGDLAAHQISTITLMIFFGAFFALVLKRFPPASSAQALAVGAMWLVLTLAFEFGFGRWRGHSWSELLQDYYLFKGRLWPLVLVWLAIAPLLLYRWYK